MPAHKLFVVLLGCLLFFSHPADVSSFFTDDFSGDSINSNVWHYFSNSGNISVSDGKLRLDRSTDPSDSFPYLYSNDNIFPESGAFSVIINYKYLSVGNFGDGIALSSGNFPVNGTAAESDTFFFLIWQDKPSGLIFIKYLCNRDGSGCGESEFLSPATNMPDYSSHSVRIEYSDRGQYSVYLDGESTPKYISDINQVRPKRIWMGNPLHTGTSDLWSSFEVDSIYIDTNNQKNKTIIIPGLGASWDLSAILTGTDGNNWKIPKFVTNYDGLLASFKNAGYEEGKNLFVFEYDWRKPLDSLADKFNMYVQAKIPSGENVNIVGHSMGGLVARAYSQKYGVSRVNKIVTVGSPNMGSAKAYGAWEGGMIFDQTWWGKLALSLTTHFGVIAGESAIDTVQRTIPSLKDLLPTYDYLILRGSPVPWTSMTHKNLYLDGLNQNSSGIDEFTTAIYSNDHQTTSKIKVTPHTLGDLDTWVDGKPVGDQPFIYENGDGTVIETSAKGQFTNTIKADGWHGELVTKQENIQKIFGVLEIDPTKAVAGAYDDRTNVFVVALRSPGKLDVCNKELSLCNEQLGLYFSDEKLFVLPGYDGQQLMVSVSENGNMGKYGLHFGDIDKKASWKIVGGDIKRSGQIDMYIVSDEKGRFSVQTLPKDKDLCKKDWWREFGSFRFRNQGDCVRFVEKVKWLHNKFHHW